MDTQELSYAIEALLFAQGVPMDFVAIRAAVRRGLPDESEAFEQAAEAEHRDLNSASTSEVDAIDKVEVRAEAATAHDQAEAGAAEERSGDGLAQEGTVPAPDEAQASTGTGTTLQVGTQAPGDAERNQVGAEASASERLVVFEAPRLRGNAAARRAQLLEQEAATPAPRATDATAAGVTSSAGPAQATLAATPEPGHLTPSASDEAAPTTSSAVAAPAQITSSASAEAAAQPQALATTKGNDVVLDRASGASWTDDAAFALTSPVIHAPRAPSLSTQVRAAIATLQRRWQERAEERGFTLVEVAGGLTFRTNVRYAAMLRAVREQKPQRLSRPALEALAIVAYRQPVTKPQVDELRGVDSGGSLKVLLERRLVAVVGKLEEPGRPLLYGTTATFLSFFNLRGVADLPSLREFHDLSDDDQDALRAFEGLPGLSELAQEGKNFRADEALGTDELEEAVAALQRTQSATRAALLAQGVELEDLEAGEEAPRAATPPTDVAAPTQH